MRAQPCAGAVGALLAASFLRELRLRLREPERGAPCSLRLDPAGRGMSARGVTEAREALHAAALAYAAAEGAPNIDGIAARVWRRMQLLRAGDAYGLAVRLERERLAARRATG
jgi:hypothetical protein